MTVEIKLKRSGFPVKIGEIELWFDSSYENLKSFLDIEKLMKEKMKKAQEKAKKIRFSANITEKQLEELTEEDIESMNLGFDFRKEFIAAQYDIIFGDGTFKKIYKKYPDIAALEKALNDVGVAIAKEIDSLNF